MVKKIVVLFFCQLFFFNFTTSLILAPTQVGLTEILNLTKTQNEESIQKLRTQALRKKIDVAWELTLDARTSKLCNDPEVEIYYQAAISAWENIKQLHSEVRQADFIRKALIYDLDQTKNITKLNSWTLAFSQKNLNPYFISGERYIFIEAFSKEEQRDYNGAQQIWGNLKSKLGKAEDHDLWARNQNQLVSEISTAIKVWNDAAKEAIDNKDTQNIFGAKSVLNIWRKLFQGNLLQLSQQQFQLNHYDDNHQSQDQHQHRCHNFKEQGVKPRN